MEKFIRDREIAATFNVSRNTVWRWVREGRIPAPVRVSAGTTRWPESVLAIIARGDNKQKAAA